jgi:hypothetical protein
MLRLAVPDLMPGRFGSNELVICRRTIGIAVDGPHRDVHLVRLGLVVDEELGAAIAAKDPVRSL